MKNIVITIFNEESRTYEALSLLKQDSQNLDIIASGIIKNNHGSLEIKDGFDLSEYDDNWAAGGLIGGLLGILGGPVGVLLGSGLGMTIGTGFDLDELEDNQSVFKQVAQELGENKLALLTVADESDEQLLNQLLMKEGAVKIIRKSYVDVQTEIFENQELEKQLAKAARAQMRAEKKEKWHAMAEAKQQELSDKLKTLKRGK
ncbi:hypothetical protein I6N95_08520 [Vagococcus sp. BWB3-3]|uniref:DUF1269 domain-containing protein n=1 Tax=Vagococcus allomyrinae TaxID=2794353 RepID=A0A940P4T4_9ENTE|nr:hypothetical protein [Vagococcus allomyrinae]MBP1041045.1 hypothetical protein [Vagococcus allomyrinae]